MSVIDKAVQWAINTANDNSHGYSQVDRWAIPGYEGYTVSRDGTIYSKDGTPMRNHETKKGYYRVRVYKDGRKQWLMNHRAVAITFIPNPDNLYCVNHKDEDKKNNHVENLEWCTLEYNLGYGTKPYRTGVANQKTKGHKVIRLLNGREVLYPSVNAASIATNVARSTITRMCKSSGEWRYAV